MKGKLRMKKAEDGKVFVVMNLKLAGEEGTLTLKARQEDLRRREIA
jgi:hypothetical protein